MIMHKRHTESQCSQCLIFLQCKPNFFCSFISNTISHYEQYQAKDILRSSVVSVSFFCNASPISFAPSSPIMFSPLKNKNLIQQKHTEIQHSQYIILLQCKSNFPSLLRVRYNCGLQIVLNKRYTQIQRSQCVILLQYRPNFFGSFIAELIAPYKQQQEYQTKVQGSQCIILLQPKSNFLCSFISNIIGTYEHSKQYQAENIPRPRLVSALFFCNASPISFAPSLPTLFSSMDSSKSSEQMIYRCSAQSAYYSSAMQVQFPLLLHFQHYFPLWIVAKVPNK
eukprot:TRINITY_DN1542_c0_g1_i4.p1 TRINITY_DN1542_c0_g1~~TRINITY_DN1542_c0_g1_i4.p1  ORF type:complete len:281 (+),score=-41.36 TRINITY_DN1542_c0_g1_i4:848-1690(+)